MKIARRTFLAALVVLSVNVWAGISAATVWEVRTTGLSTNGGGWVAGASGTDWTQQDACKYSLTGLTSAGAGNIVLTALAASDWVGNIWHQNTGTNFNAGFYEITSVSAGVSATLSTSQAGASVSTGVGASGTACIGGAYKFGTSVDATWSAGVSPGNTTWIQAGSYTLNTAFATTDSSATHQSFITGYNATRGDNPTGASRPSINLAGTSNDLGSFSVISNLIFTGTASAMMASDGSNVWYNIKSTNTSATSARNALSPGAGDTIINSELVSQAGRGLTFAGDVFLIGNYIHDSPTCINSTSTGDDVLILNNVLAGCPTAAINLGGANTSISLIAGNTIYGSERKDGTGVTVATSNANAKTINNIFYGLATGVSATTANTASYSNWNDFNNVTTPRTNWSTGASDFATNPGFISTTTTVSGTAGVVSGSTLTDSGASYANVVDNRDYLVIISGTGVTNTPGSLLITSHTGTVLTVAAAIGGTGTNISYFVRTGHNFAVSPTMKWKGFPGLFPAGFTTGYLDAGAAQRHEYGRPVKH